MQYYFAYFLQKGVDFCRKIVYNKIKYILFNGEDTMLNYFKEKGSEYYEAVIGNSLYDLLKFLIIYFISTIFTLIVGDATFSLFSLPFFKQYKLGILIILVLIVSFLVLEIYTRKFRKIPNYPPVDTDYEIEKKESFFTYGREQSSFKSIIDYKSNINNLRRLYGKYTWSGSEDATIKCYTKNYRLLPLARKDSFIEYEIELGLNHKRGQRGTYMLKGEMPDSKHTFVPFFSIQITEITKTLIIHVQIPPEYGVEEVIREEIAIVRNSNDNSKTERLDEDGSYTWTIQNPKLFYKYSIRWDLN